MTTNTVKPARRTNPRTAARPAAPEPDVSDNSVPRHLARGAVGFVLITGAIGLIPVIGPPALLAAPLALIAFRGCPTCWLAGLAQTIARGRLERRCTNGACTLTKAHLTAPRGANCGRGEMNHGRRRSTTGFSP